MCTDLLIVGILIKNIMEIYNISRQDWQQNNKAEVSFCKHCLISLDKFGAEFLMIL